MVIKTKSCAKLWFCQLAGEFRVLKRILSPRLMSYGLRSSTLIETLSLISITLAGPMIASNGTWSMLFPVAIKCSGASICVPVCAPIDIVELLTISPLSIETRRSICTLTSLGQTTIPFTSGVVTSIHFFVVMLLNLPKVYQCC